MGKKNKNKSQKKVVQQDPELTAFQLKERRTRTCFVGNLPLEFDQNDLRKIFKECGNVEKIWFRSVPTILDSKLPLKAKIIKKELGQQKDNKNAYVLMSDAQSALKAKELLNQKEFGGKHIRVDIDREKKEDGGEPSKQNQNDFDTTIFIGNLPFVLNEEDLRRHFAGVSKSESAGLGGQGDGILNVRVIRDSFTHLGKGIAYIQFTSKPLMRHAIESLNGKQFMGRELRIKKAVAPQRLEKKKIRQEEKSKLREQQIEDKKINMIEEDDEIKKLQKLTAGYESEDSFDEEERTKKVKISNKSKKISKENDTAEFESHIRKIAKKQSEFKKKNDVGIDITPKLAHNKKTQVLIQKQKLESKDGKTSKIENHKNSMLFKDQQTFKQQLKGRIEKKRKLNLKKINTIKVKKQIN